MSAEVADAVLVKDAKVLLVQQSKKVAYGLWSFPGGHLEDGETLEDTVRREVEEEVGLRLGKIFPLTGVVDHVYEGGKKVNVHSFVGDFTGTIVLENELLAYDWFSLDDIKNMKGKLRSNRVLDAATAALSQQLSDNS